MTEHPEVTKIDVLAAELLDEARRARRSPDRETAPGRHPLTDAAVLLTVALR